METYGLWKTLHVLSATVRMGAGIGIAFFCWFGSREAMIFTALIEPLDSMLQNGWTQLNSYLTLKLLALFFRLPSTLNRAF